MLGNNSADEGSYFEENKFKSCFARSVVVNSQYNFKSLNDQGQLQKKDNSVMIDTNKGESLVKVNPREVTVSKVVKRECMVENRRLDSRRSSACSSRIAEMPVENLVLKSQIETLEWQLKQTEASREMYRAVMEQVVKFLEKAHESLQRLGSKVGSSATVPRSQSDYHMITINENKNATLDLSSLQSPPRSIDSSTDYTAFRDFTWRRQRKPQPTPDEIPLEKLSQEAFRLLRTAQSLLSTRAPDLAHVNNSTSEDLEFLEQLAKEFPRPQEHEPDKPGSSPTLQLMVPNDDIRISTALNRKLSLQRSNSKRHSFYTSSPKIPTKQADFENGDRGSDCGSSIVSCRSLLSEKDKRLKFEPEKSNSPPVSNCSAEDESGFSSMTSFQELGIPVLPQERITKDVLLKSMLQEDERSKKIDVLECSIGKDLKLWEKPAHRRWSSTPIQEHEIAEKQPLKHGQECLFRIK